MLCLPNLCLCSEMKPTLTSALVFHVSYCVMQKRSRDSCVIDLFSIKLDIANTGVHSMRVFSLTIQPR